MDGPSERQTVRPAAHRDGETLRRLFAQANEEFRTHVPAAIYRNYLQNLLDLVAEAPPAGMLVAEDAAGRVVGTGTVLRDGASMHAAWPAGCAVLRAMAVEPAARGRGLARLVAEACLVRARSDGATAVGLHTAPFMVAATRLYHALGFQRVPQFDAPIGDFFGPAADGYDERATAFRLDLVPPPRGAA